MVDYNDIFEEVRSSIQTKEYSDPIWKEKMKFDAGKDYVVRLLPYIKEGREGVKKSLFHYIRYTWNDQNGKWINCLSPRTYGENCPISDYSKRIKYKGTKEEQEEMQRRLTYREGAYVNVYVIKDPTNPENEGKVKIVDMGKKLYNIVKSALDGELDAAWTAQARKYSLDKNIEINVGKKVFDLSPEGVNLVIRVRKNQFNLNSYETSEIVMDETGWNKSNDEINEILNSCHDLAQIDKQRSYDEIVDLFKTTYLASDVDAFATPKEQEPVVIAPKAEEIESSTWSMDPVPSFSQTEPVTTTETTTTSVPNTEASVDDWLAGFMTKN